MQATAARVLGPKDGKAGFLGSIGVRFMIDGAETGGGFSLVEHPMSPRSLAAPLHRHSREDEYSFVLEGRVGALLGDEVLVGGPGDLIFKPRGQWHTFWNAGDEPARLLDAMGGAMEADPQAFGALAARYGLELQPDTVPELLERFDLRVGERI